jgi:hypothetical protein
MHSTGDADGRRLHLMPPGAHPQLVLADPSDPYQDGYVLSFRAELTGEGLNATSHVVVSQGRDLDAFFDRLAVNWQGWQGEQLWDSLEHDLSIAAAHDGIGQVRLRVTLRESYRPDPWAASATFIVQAGEELPALASKIARFLAT